MPTEIKKSDLEEALQTYFTKKFRNAAEKIEGELIPVNFLYSVVLKPTQVNMDSPEIQRLILRVTAVHMTGRVGKFVNLTQLFNPIYLLCMFCREDRFLSVLDNLWAKGTIGISIPDLERKIAKAGLFPKINGKIIPYDALHYSYKQVEQKLDIIFNEVCAKNNIPEPEADITKILSGIGDLEK